MTMRGMRMRRSSGSRRMGRAAYLLAARMLLRREYLPVAQGFAEKALVLQPGLPLAHALLGEIALAGNHIDEAIAQFELERKSDPMEPSVYDRLGDAYGRAARYDEAQASLQEAVLLEPNSTGPYILLGKTMLKKGDAVGAATYLERAEKMDPANYMTHSLLGQSYRAMGRTEDASRETATSQHGCRRRASRSCRARSEMRAWGWVLPGAVGTSEKCNDGGGVSVCRDAEDGGAA